MTNGIVSKDKNFGAKTHTNISVVDYIIVPPSLLQLADGFEILSFDPLLSDVLNILVLQLIC